MPRRRKMSGSKPANPQWWKTFFTKWTGDLMFEHFVGGGTEREVDEILKKTKVGRDARILDLACGRGRHSVEFAARGFQTVGLDYSKPYLAQARSLRAGRRDPSLLRLVHGDMRNLERLCAVESFDVVLSLFNSFGYLPERSDDIDVLRQIAGVLKPGGVLVLGTISRSGFCIRSERAVRAIGWNSGAANFFSRTPPTMPRAAVSFPTGYASMRAGTGCSAPPSSKTSIRVRSWSGTCAASACVSSASGAASAPASRFVPMSGT
jgi:SAM-dependent methyltransferase